MTRTGKQNDPQVEALVNEYMDRHPVLKRLGTRALPGTVRMGEWGWSVIVGSERDPKSTFEYVSELADVMEELETEEGLDVVLAPSSSRPSEMVK